MEADEDGLFEDDTPMPDRPADCWVSSKPVDRRRGASRSLRPRLLPDRIFTKSIELVSWGLRGISVFLLIGGINVEASVNSCPIGFRRAIVVWFYCAHWLRSEFKCNAGLCTDKKRRASLTTVYILIDWFEFQSSAARYLVQHNFHLFALAVKVFSEEFGLQYNSPYDFLI